MHQDSATPGIWIFLSHSNHDFDDVRRLRDLLESRGHKPIMFFLKSLDDHPNDDELWRLIEREIDARDWFLLCDSPNAQESNNVRHEIEIITTRPDKVFETINIMEDLKPQMGKIESLEKRATVFISHHRQDAQKAESIRQVFEQHDYAVFHDVADVQLGANWRQQIEDAIREASNKGFFILLLSDKSLTSQWVRTEIKCAFCSCGQRRCQDQYHSYRLVRSYGPHPIDAG